MRTTRQASTVVLPVPAPATARIGPSMWSTATCCCGVSSKSRGCQDIRLLPQWIRRKGESYIIRHQLIGNKPNGRELCAKLAQVEENQIGMSSCIPRLSSAELRCESEHGTILGRKLIRRQARAWKYRFDAGRKSRTVNAMSTTPCTAAPSLV